VTGIPQVAWLDRIKAEAEGMDDPLGIVTPVFHTRHESVTQEIVHAVRIELARHDVTKEVNGKCSVDYGANLVWIDLLAPENLVHFRCGISDNQSGPAFVAGGGAKCTFDCMRKRSMACIVKERRRLYGFFVVIDKANDFDVSSVTQPEMVENPPGKAHNAQTVGKAGVLGTWISDIANAELADAP
jgi:hypothetical protein